MSAPALLDGVSHAGQADALRQATRWVASASADVAADTAEQARLLTIYLKAVKAAEELRIEATRLECTALRRIAQAGSVDKLPSGRRAAARLFAAMPDDVFAKRMTDLGRARTAMTVYRMVMDEQFAKDERERGQRVGWGEPAAPITATNLDLAQLAQAAGALLFDLAADGAPFTVTEVADQLARDFHHQADGPAREGYREVVRQALRATACDPPAEHDYRSPLHPELPAWITYEEDGIGWVRIPAASASLAQLRQMSALRRTQADAMDAAACSVEQILSDLEEVASGDNDRLADLSATWAKRFPHREMAAYHRVNDAQEGAA